MIIFLLSGIFFFFNDFTKKKVYFCILKIHNAITWLKKYYTHPPLTNCDETVWRKTAPFDEDNSNYDKLEYAVTAKI